MDHPVKGGEESTSSQIIIPQKQVKRKNGNFYI